MTFQEAYELLKKGELIQIAGEKFALVIHKDRNLETAVIYITTNGFAQGWCPQVWQLDSDQWEVIK